MQVLVGDHKHDGDSEVVVDYNGNPADKSRTGGWLAAGLILGWYRLHLFHNTSNTSLK